MSERDYIDRTIATVRNHRDADNCWPQWANVLADEVERLRAERERAEALAEELAKTGQPMWAWIAQVSPLNYHGLVNPDSMLDRWRDAHARYDEAQK